MTIARASQAYNAHVGSTNSHRNQISMRAASRSRVCTVRAATILLPSERASIFDDDFIMDVETLGGVPNPPKPASFDWNDWPVEGSIIFGVAKTPINNSIHNAEYCDPLLGHSGKDVLPNYLVNDLKFTNTTELCAVALQIISAAATGQAPSHVSPAKAAESLNYFLFVEKVINISNEEYLGPQALSLIVKMMSYLSFNAATSDVLRRQHESLAKKAFETFSDACGYEPFSVDVEMLVDVYESHARASDILSVNTLPLGAIFGRRQLQLLQPMGDGSVSASQAARLLVAWSTLEARFEMNFSNQQIAFLANTFCVGIKDCSLWETEALASAMAGYKYVPASTTFPLLEAICKEAIERFAANKASAADAGAVLAVAEHAALYVPRNTAVQELKEKVARLLLEHGIPVDSLLLEHAI